MKKRFITGLLSTVLVAGAAFAGGTATPVADSPSSSTGLEISGNVDVLVGYQRDSSNALAGSGFGGLTQGDLGMASTASGNHFQFMVDQVEIDLAKEFGENIRVRADIDAQDLTGSGRAAAGDVFNIEQAYVTWNVGSGDGAEWAIGKFNAPIGLEGVDRNENPFVTYTLGFQDLLPTNVIGTKIYYAFNDTWNMDIGVVNDINASAGDSLYPTGILRVGANWGDEGNKSFVNLGGAVGPETVNNGDLDFLADVWGQVALSDAWDLGFELTYRQSMVDAAKDSVAYAGQLYALWEASDLWTVQLRYAAVVDNRNATFGAASTTGLPHFIGQEGMVHSATLGASYAIADEAKVKFEYRFDLAAPDGAAANNAYYNTGVAEFAYSF